MIDWDLAVGTFSGYDLDDGLGIQVDGLGEKASGLSPFETLFPLGFLARPMDPETAPDGTPIRGCTVLRGWLGNRGFVLPMTDPRLPGTLPVLQKGESMMFGFAGQFIRCKADGSIALYTTSDGTTDGKAVSLELSPDRGLEIQMPWGRLTLGPNGFHVTTAKARLDLNAIAGLPAPFDIIGSMATIQADMVVVNGGIVKIGPGPTDATMKYTANMAALSAITSALAAIASAAAAPGNADAKLAAIAALAGGAVGAVSTAVAAAGTAGKGLATAVS